MLPKYHIITGAILTPLIYSIFPITILQATIIFFSSFLIDVDHYLLYIFQTKDLSFKRARKYFIKRRKRWISLPLNEREKYKRPIFIFHGIEFWLLLILLTNYTSLIWFVLLGILIHITLDYIDLIYLRASVLSKFSQFYVYFSNKKKEEFD